jgi:putative hydrolase of the HAD superfamily
MQHIKNIIFDFGGIFIDIDYNKTEQAFIQAGITNFAELYTQHHASTLFEDLETGKISIDYFYEQLRQIAGVNLTNHQIETAWNALLGNFLWKEIDWLETIGQRYKLFLYSNTNAIHYQAFASSFEQQKGKRFDSYFITAYYSHTLGLRKPYESSYKAILEKEGLQANETLFIDDTLTNIEGAAAAGLHTIHLVPPARVSALGL